MPLLSVRDLRVEYPTARGLVRAVNGVSFDIASGETVGLVGESGCGKSTLGRAILRLAPITGGSVAVEGRDITGLTRRELEPVRPVVQMIFQDPQGSLNPRSTVGRSVGQPLAVAGWDRDAIEARVAELLRLVGLPPEAAHRFPHEFSGGQRQRIGIARALALKPKLIVCDEPVSALDVSVRAQVINLLKDLQAELKVSYLFISHDLSVVEHISDRVLVMYLGRIVEAGGRERIWRRPLHPYTRALLAAAPASHPRLARLRPRAVLEGELPSPLNPPTGCAFHARCPLGETRCREAMPTLRSFGPDAAAACHVADATGGLPWPAPTNQPCPGVRTASL
ncbi:peptide/nickel transport system ATP-binding protein [Azospirillum baldaniorum]|uniref:ABC transporter ATP-binding protein n=1 Tax=Azospirillum baldaniorum TaxID=1064539 RepID=UPI00119FA2F0|nr:oligopeptide/dipeptide ABC transporter ATP-binding protein [Azospirillum baldaniorum]TWA57392.1 peptide/nickel transport system ATP-binding protein [Azospirillum baldaniorum]